MKKASFDIRGEKERKYPVLSTFDFVCHAALAWAIVAGVMFLLLRTLLTKAPHISNEAALLATKVLG